MSFENRNVLNLRQLGTRPQSFSKTFVCAKLRRWWSFHLRAELALRLPSFVLQTRLSTLRTAWRAGCLPRVVGPRPCIPLSIEMNRLACRCRAFAALPSVVPHPPHEVPSHEANYSVPQLMFKSTRLTKLGLFETIASPPTRRRNDGNRR